MRNHMIREAERFVKQDKKRRMWQKVLGCMAAVVVFCTTYALILPAITMERNNCGQEEHIHSESCYEKVVTQQIRNLTCTYESLNVHEHTDLCDTEGCGCADFLVHEHDTDCWNGAGDLVCQLPEIREHEHTQACYRAVETQPAKAHEHNDGCYTLERGNLICTTEETEGHTHGDNCFLRGELLCQKAETEGHQHTEACMNTLQICEITDPEHEHTDECYEAELICGKPEEAEHAHTKDCYEKILNCDLEAAEAHRHGDDCYEQVKILTCTLETEPLSSAEAQTDAQELEETVQELICEEPVIRLHSHENACYEIYLDENGKEQRRLTCSQTEILSHSHSESCFAVQEIPTEDVDTLTCTLTQDHVHGEACYGEDGALICTEPENHIHSELCYGTWKLICGEEEHTHSSACTGLTEEQLTQVEAVIAAIDEMPSAQEIENRVAQFQEQEDEEGEIAYLEQVYSQVRRVNGLYIALGEDLQTYVTNRDKLMELEYIWSQDALTVTAGIPVYQVNSYVTDGTAGGTMPTVFYGKSADDYGYTQMPFAWWSVIVVEKTDSSTYYVSAIDTEGGVDKSAYAPKTSDGFVLLVWHDTIAPSDLNVSVGDLVDVPFGITSSLPYTGTSYGNITFANKDKDNSSKLAVVQSADTSRLIELNLYDYDTRINDPYNITNNYPGFQQDGGTLDTFNTLGLGTFNFGNNITSDLGAGILSVTNNGGAINATSNAHGYGAANEPISGAMYPTLIEVDGVKSPALADGTNLKYLFTANGGYGTKRNTNNVNGLFRKNQISGAYVFNSRENHAQFNPRDDTFTLYKQTITSNFMMYPFGNFLPFNDIVKKSAQATTIDREYLQLIAKNADKYYNLGGKTESAYLTLSNRLTEFINVMDAKHETGWGAAEAVKEYFTVAGILTESLEFNTLLQPLYCIDYDEPTDFFFGMEMKMNLMMPKDGLTGNDWGDNSSGWKAITNNPEYNGTYIREGSPDGIPDYPMFFEFTGDDDVWVYVDDVLFLDLSGIHRHVGGTIDFQNGIIYYFGLDKATGDTDQSNTEGAQYYAYDTFEQILTKAGRSTDGLQTVLNADGTAKTMQMRDGTIITSKTFQDYSVHTFNFYYMERGAGSSVCRINFNFPMLKQNAISVAKNLSTDNPDKTDLLGDPDFRFQILKANAEGSKLEELFIAPGTAYTIYDVGTNEVKGTGTTDANGIFTLKACQRAEFTGIKENAGKYYVRELLNTAEYEQFGSITVDGNATTRNNDITIDSVSFTGLDSPVKDASEGSTLFCFDNSVKFDKLGSLAVTKILNRETQTEETGQVFNMRITLDNKPLPVGTKYTLSDRTVGTVAEAGIIPLQAGQTAVLEGILAGTRFTVSETSQSAEGYVVGYTCSNADNAQVSGSGVSGEIVMDVCAGIAVTNAENAAKVFIPVTKQLTNGDLSSGPHRYQFSIARIGAKDGDQADLDLYGNYRDTIEVALSNGARQAQAVFDLAYLSADFADNTKFPVTVTYEIRESAEGVTDAATDPVVYCATVTVDKGQDGKLTAELIELKKDESTVDSAIFVNTLISDLRLQKIVEGGQNAQETAAFRFRVTLKDAQDNPLAKQTILVTASGTVTPSGSVATDENGSVIFANIHHQDTAVIHGLPAGIRWTIEELNTDGYAVAWQSGSASAEGKTAAGELPFGGAEVVFTNTSTYVLPQTGGRATNQYTMTGMFLMLLSAVCLMYGSKARRREEF